MISDDPSTVKPTLDQLQATFRSGKTLDINYRKQQLNNFMRGLKELTPKLNEALYQDLHQCATFGLLANVGGTMNQVKLCLAELDNWVKPTAVDTPALMAPAKSYVSPDPYGVVLILGAWNYPIYLTLAYLAYAIAAGNCVVIKPSELAAHSSNAMAELIEKYLDKDAYRCIEGAVAVAQAAVKEPFDRIMFTGGTQTGKLVAKAAADNLVPCILELGGKSPTIVNKEADIENAALRIARAKLMNIGQTCIACDYAFVHKDIKDKFIEAYKQKTIQFYGEDASLSPDYGRIINVAHTKRLQSYLQEDHGGKLVMGGQVNINDKYVAPALIENPRPDSLVMKNEIFGPILPFYEFTDIGEVITFINDRPKPLALYYYGSPKSQEFKLLKARTSSGALVANDSFTQVLSEHLPFGGVGASGYGTVNGYHGFKAFSHFKAVMECNTINSFPASVFFPPFNETSNKVITFTGKFVHVKQRHVMSFLILVVVLLVLFALLSNSFGFLRAMKESSRVIGNTLGGIGGKEL